MSLDNLTATIAYSNDLSLSDDIVFFEFEKGVSSACLITNCSLDKSEFLAILETDHVEFFFSFDNSDLDVVTAATSLNVFNLDN
jgi:hypothetical protein